MTDFQIDHSMAAHRATEDALDDLGEATLWSVVLIAVAVAFGHYLGSMLPVLVAIGLMTILEIVELLRWLRLGAVEWHVNRQRNNQDPQVRESIEDVIELSRSWFNPLHIWRVRKLLSFLQKHVTP